MVHRRRVALLIEGYLGYGRGLLHGIAAYVRQHGPWSIYHQPWVTNDEVVERLRRWRPEGIIAQLDGRSLSRQLSKLRVPMIDLFGAYELPGVPRVLPDHEAVARLAATHLLERGLRHFAYCGIPGVHFCDYRRRCFVDYMTGLGYPVSVFRTRGRTRRTSVFTAISEAAMSSKAVMEWLLSLPRPLGLMVCDDALAQQVLDACGEHGIVVPDEVSVISVGNDEVFCEFCNPPLTSIELRSHDIGFQAAATLDHMLDHGQPPSEIVLVQPMAIMARQSTNMAAVADADVRAALLYIWEHACEGISVDDVAREVASSRRTLQRRFAEYVGHSPGAEITRVQLLRTKDLLSQTDLPLSKVASSAGFRYVESMCALFKNKTGQTPGEYRRLSRAMQRRDAIENALKTDRND